jgi:transposase
MDQIREREADVAELISLNEDFPEYFSEEDYEDLEEPKVARRGRPRVPEKWSRVISLGEDNLNALRSFELAGDLLLESAVVETLEEPKDEV